MPISKRAMRKGGPIFAVVTRNAVDDIADADGIAVLTYLLTKPDSWVIRKEDVKANLGMGEVRCRKAFKLLKDKGYMWFEYTRDELGKITSKQTWIGAEPRCQVSNALESQPDGEPTPLEKIYRLDKKDKYARFDEFWALYPKKVSKADARKAWGAKSDSEKDSAITDVAGRQWPEDHQYIPYPASYIRGCRWEDEQEKRLAVEVSYL